MPGRAKKPRSLERGFRLLRSPASRAGCASGHDVYIALLSPPSPASTFLVSTNNNGSPCVARGPRVRGVRRRGASSSTGVRDAAEPAAAAVSINTSGSLGAVSRLRRRAGRGVDRGDVASSIWSTFAATAILAVSESDGVLVDETCIGATAGAELPAMCAVDVGTAALGCIDSRAPLAAAVTGTSALADCSATSP